MRIAMFSWETLHSSAIGGVATHVSELSAALARRGHEVHVFTRPGHGLGSVQQVGDVWYHYCPHDLEHDFVDEIQAMCRSLVWHFSETEKHVGRFDVIHSHDWLTADAVRFLTRDRATIASCSPCTPRSTAAAGTTSGTARRRASGSASGTAPTSPIA